MCDPWLGLPDAGQQLHDPLRGDRGSLPSELVQAHFVADVGLWSFFSQVDVAAWVSVVPCLRR